MTDFYSIMTGEAPQASKPRKTGTLSLPKDRMDPTDAMIRTVYGESGTPGDERKWIAGVIANRAKMSGKDYTDVVLEKGQFEPWQDAKARKRMEGLKVGSPEYEAVRADIQEVLDGADPTGGATHFYAPKAQAALGREKPDWDTGTGTQVGETLFIKGDYGEKGGPDFASLMAGGADPSADDKAFEEAFGLSNAPPVRAAGSVVDTGLFKDLTPAQQEAYKRETLAHGIDPKAPPGSINNPRWITEGHPVENTPPGEYYRDTNGKLLRMAGGEEKPGAGILGGAAQGVADVGTSIAQILDVGDEGELTNRAKLAQERYDADHKGETAAGLGRFTGQLGATILPGAGLAKGAGLVAKAGGPIGEFLAGQAAGAGLKGKILGAASKGAAGAAEGATASALVSSANDQPLGEQLKTGAILGGVLRPAGSALKGGISRFVGNKGLNAEQLAEAARLAAANKALPIEVPLTVGQLTGSPTQQMAESALRKGVKGEAAKTIMKTAEDEATDAILGNAAQIGERIAGAPVVRGQSGEMISDALNAKRDIMKRDKDAAYQRAEEMGADAMLGDSKAVRERMLSALSGFDLDDVPSVAKKIEAFGERGAPTARDMSDLRAKLSSLRGGAPTPTTAAAAKAIAALDEHIDEAMTNDLILGDPEAIKAWRTAIGKNRELMKVFGSDDLVGKLTKREERGGQMVRTIDPDEAANYIFGRASLGTAARPGLTRDLKRLRTILGTDSSEWNALRGEMFERFVAPARKNADVEGPAFSGQNFRTAWEKAKIENNALLQTMFTPDERQLIDDFAEIAQRATTKVKGGDNPSGSGFVIQGQVQKALDNLWTMLGSGAGAIGGGAVGGPLASAPGAAGGAVVGRAMDAFFKDIKAVKAAQKAVAGNVEKVAKPGLASKLLPRAAIPSGVVTAGSLNNRLTASPSNP